MSEHEFHRVDFDNPSLLFIIEDWLKYKFGKKIFYKSYFNSIGINGNENILDFGCGGGAGSKIIATLLNGTGQLTCIDTSKYWTDKARLRLSIYKNVDVLCGDIRNVNLPDNFFEIISIFHVLHDIQPEIRQETINSLKNKLTATGRIVILEPIKISHGISSNELEFLMKNAGLKKLTYRQNEKDYYGEFRLN